MRVTVSLEQRFQRTPDGVRWTFEQMYKGQDILLKAVAVCRKQSLPLYLTMIGDGQFKPKMIALARKLNITDQVIFTGILPHDEVRHHLEQSGLFVMPSLTEGLPRALIEAMSVGLPCIASNVGGIPELLVSEDLVKPGCPMALAQKIKEVLADQKRLQIMSERNWKRAQDFRAEQIIPRRRSFYKLVGDATAEWQLSMSK